MNAGEGKGLTKQPALNVFSKRDEKEVNKIKSEVVMAGKYNVGAKVVAIKGDCSAGHKVGDEFVIGKHTPAGLCCSAFHMILPKAVVLMTGGQYSWQQEPDVISNLGCPDSSNLVLFDLKRVPAK